MLDLLSDILTRLSVKGTLYFRTSFTSPWGVEVPAYQNVARFHFAHRGDCMVRITETDQTLMLAQGDLVIIPHGAGHSLYGSASSSCSVLPLDRVCKSRAIKVKACWFMAATRETGRFNLSAGIFLSRRIQTI